MVIFNSRNLIYRNPFGAVEEGVFIHFKIILKRSLGCRYSTLKVFQDESSEVENINMYWCGMYGDNHEMWECDYAPSRMGLYWYNFEITTNSFKKTIGKSDSTGNGVLDCDNKWQLTCYKRDFKTPKWMYNGVMYQIFPDRFYNSGKPKNNVPKDRILHENWLSPPIHTPNDKGEYLNNDFFKGDIQGIIEKIPYLKKLGVTCVYLNPIFESHSNHRYDTADYEKIDPLLGTESDYDNLCKELRKNGIHLILDGVFSHTGQDSKYFNKFSRYDTIGAFNSKQSDFYDWYSFEEWPNVYKSWWGINSLPETNETCKSFNDFINGEHGIIRKWIKKGASGWRLDVADELPDEFLYELRKAAKSENPECFILGEVWEDASNKISYGHRRKFILGNQLDSVMNYPFKDAILDFVCGKDSFRVMETILSVLENYPPPVIKVLMNPLSTHDTIRAITLLAGTPYINQDRNFQATTRLSKEQYDKGIILMKLASAIQFTLPGVPCIYYGDEAGVEGYLDPFNRKPFPWNHENEELIKWHIYLAKLRKDNEKAFSGNFSPLKIQKNFISYIWQNEKSSLLCFFNAGNEEVSVNLSDFNFSGEVKIQAKSCKIIENR